MATLTGQQIDASYLGLLKTTDNAVIGVTAKALTDGGGNATNITISNTATNFVSGTVDFTGSTVSGLGVVSAGLVEGNYPNSFIAGGSLTGISANTAQGWESMAVGSSCVSASPRSTALGQSSIAGTFGSAEGGAVAIGWNAQVTGEAAIGIGGSGTKPNRSTGNNAITIGQNINANTGNNSIIIGADTTSNGSSCVNIGYDADSTGGDFCTAIGYAGVTGNRGLATGCLANATGSTATSYGYYSNAVGIASFAFLNNGSASGPYSVGIGANTYTDTAASDSVAIGRYARSSAVGAYALGNGVPGGAQFIANRVNTVSVHKLAIEDISGGIIMKSPDGTEYTLTVANGGTLVIT